ncbi:FecR domain-containing protein [Bradyrhizobium sp. UFLA05-112]
MNYAGKFDAALSMDGKGFHAPANGHVDSFSVSGHGQVPHGAFFVPNPNLLFHGEFKRAGVDLVLSNDGHEFVIHDYFKGEKRAAIASPDGAHLTGDIVNALAGNVQYAQAAPGASAAQVIGHITKLTGSATAVRNGVSIILNNGDNVEKGDVLSTGSDSTLGVTFIDGTVFGLSSNARMVLNEMVYDPNGSSNSSLLSLVAGTITFVAGETAKHGDMKIDTPVATMGIRGTAVLTEISFSVPSGGGDPQPQANFQVLVEPDGTTGSYILFDKVTLLPIATVNQAGQMIQISGGNVSVTNALLSPDVQKLITDVFSLKFTDNSTNTKLTNNSTDSITQDANLMLIKTASGATAQATFVTVNPGSNGSSTNTPDKPTSLSRVPGAPLASSLDSSGNVKTAFTLNELDGKTGTTTLDAVGGKITFFDFNLGDRPTVKVNFDSFTYHNANHDDVTAGLSDLQKADIAATEAKISVVAAPDNSNTGSATWTYSVPDDAFDFLAAGETLTLTYRARVDNNFAANNETAFIDITVTVTGTNDTPVITSSVPVITFEGGTSVPGGPLTSEVPTSGTLTFTDVDLTDTHKVSVKLTGATLPDGSTVPPGPLAIFEKAMSVAIDTDSTGTGDGVIDWSLADLPVYLADFIPKGEVLTLTYTVTVTDSQGATATRTITVTIKGTDSPAVVWVATSEAGSPPGGFWKDAANWETGTVPTINDDVIVITDQLHGLTPSYPVTIDEAAFAKSLTMNDFDTTKGHKAPEVINQSTLTIAHTLDLSADSILTNSVGATISVGGKAEILGTSVLTNSGTVTLAGGGDFAVGALITNAGTIELAGGTLKTLAEINNAGGTLKVDAGTTLDVDGATIDGGKLIIGGALVLDGTSVLTNGKLDNSGAVTIKGAVAFDNETVDNDSTIEIQAGAALTLGQGTTVANSGGTLTVDDHGVLVLDQGEITGGTINNFSSTLGGTIDVIGDSSINGGAKLNKGAVTVESDVTLTLDDVTVSGTSITDKGIIKVDASETLTLKGASIAGGALNVSGTLSSSGASTITDTFIINGNVIEAIGGVLALVATTSATIANAGTLQANGGELDINGEPVTNTGTLATINDGTLKLISTTVTNTGATVSVDAGSTLDLVGATIDGGTLTLSGTLVSTGISAINNADITNTGTIDVAGGTLTIDPAVQHTITNQNLIEANGGELDITGDLIINTGTLEAIKGGVLKLDKVTVTNTKGTVTIDGASKLDLSDVTINGGSLGNAGKIDLHDGASLSGADGSAFAITNSGEIESWGSTSISGAITNTGSIEIDSGTMTLFGSLSGSGSVTIDANATLEVNATVSQTVTFSGGAAELKIDTASFGGSITGLTATDKLDLSSIEYGLGTYATFASNADHTGGVLTVTDADGHSISLNLVGDYSNANFAGSGDGTGHTLITLKAADDGPKFSAAETSQSASFSELADTTGAPSMTTDPTPAATGTIHFTDVDLTDRPQATITDQTVTLLDTDQTTHLTLTADEVTALEQALTLQQEGNHNNGAIGWTYSIPDSALDFLGQGQTATVVSTITLDDQHGGTDTAEVTVTISGTNDAPTLDAATLASVGGGNTDPGGAAVSDLFAGKFHDVDHGASLKAIAITADNATESQGTWQYEVAGTDQWVDIAGVSDTNALVLSPDTLIRFVPAHGYSGTPGTLDVHALDDTYAGDITGAAPVSIDITATGIGHGGSSPASDLAASISTEVTAPSNVDVWTGSVDQDWNNDGNWSLGHVPTVTETAWVDTDEKVYLDLGDNGATIGGLTLGSATKLDITGTDNNSESGSIDSYLVVNGTLANHGHIDVADAYLGAPQHVINTGTIDADGRYGIVSFANLPGSVVDNAGGTLEADDGGHIYFFYNTINGGTIDLVGEDSVALLAASIVNGTTLTADEDSYFEVLGNTTFNGSTSAISVGGDLHIDVNGKLVLEGTVNDTGSVANHGVLVADTGATTILGDLTGSGTVQILSASLELGGTSDSAVQFVGSGVGTLHLDAASHFTGTVTGFSYGDNIDLAGIDPKNVSLVSTEGGLEVHYGSGDGDYFTIAGHYDETGFSKSSDGSGGTELVWSHQSPVIDTTHFTHAHDEATNTDTVTGLSVSGSSTETYTVTAQTEGAKEGSNVTPSFIDGASLDQVNTALHSVTYDPGVTPPNTDMITFKVTDSLGASDTVNFIFDEGGSGPVTLTGTSGKDVIFATESSDTLISGGGQDQFVFAPASTTDAVQHTVYGFDTIQDKIDLRQFDTINSVADLTISQQNTDTLITLDDHETILLKNVAAGNLHASDFIVTSHGTT